ncbi:YuiB family protein [Ferviditalea candida]|uniref:YuiB family protein n=1 Tax=Ferviditalea candida TaxID=3108399 RepID=A0ABU5ZFJ7_9BACL|nr:YuiB family protein [Paenibacillaceae bacterium T2]
MIQLVIAALLIFVLIFGIGFILNMLLKTTWLPIYGYLVLLAVLLYMNWDKQGSILQSAASYTYVDYIPAVGGLVGAIMSGWTIGTLRSKGYKMF